MQCREIIVVTVRTTWHTKYTVRIICGVFSVKPDDTSSLLGSKC